jgi:two-component system, sensor histidine kinase and response regulator
MTNETILVVDDDQILLDGLRDMLELAGYRAVTAASAQEALASLDVARPDVIVSDIIMPEVDGYAFFRAVRARPELASVPFIFLTARTQRSDVLTGKHLGADDYITKPFDPEDLLVAIDGRLRRRAEIESAQREAFASLTRQMVRTLSHELRAPLTTLSAYTQLLEEGGTALSSGEFDDLMSGLQAGVSRLGRLVDDVVLLADLNSGRARTVYEGRRQDRVLLETLVTAACSPHGYAALAHGVAIEMDVPPGMPSPPGDPVYLREALSRLVDNAVKFTNRAGAVVRVRAGRAEEGVFIAVSDEGVGISPEALSRLFEPFQQVDREQQEQQGLGNGLAICRGLVGLHGGRVTATSAVGSGSTFTMFLPIQES